MLFGAGIQYHGGRVKLSRVAQFAGGIALTVAGLAVFFRDVDVHKLLRELLACHPLTITICIACAIMTVMVRAWRWNIMLPDIEKTSKRDLFPIVSIGFMLNNILPARLGEAGRIILLWKKNGFSPAQSIGSVVLERIFDTLGFMSCFFIPVFILESLRPARIPIAIDTFGVHIHFPLPLLPFAIGMCAFFLIACIIVFLYSRFPARSRGIAKKTLLLFPRSLRTKAQTTGSEILLNLNWVFSLKKAALVVMYTFLMMLCYSVLFVVLVKDANFTLITGLFAQAFAAIGAAIPLAPGYVGTLHFVLLQGLLLCGLDRDKAVAIALLYHGIPYFPMTALGLFYYFKMRISFKEISQAKNHLHS
jgi:glycosyltransferase 2 family protein